MRDLSWFCDTDTDSRYALDKPWFKDGFQYATNGRIAVRQKADGEPHTDDGKTRPRVVCDLFPEASCTEQWPTPSGVNACPIEDSSDFGIVAANIEIAGRLIAGCYILLVSLLGDVKYDPSGTPDDPLRFAADGIEGTVMPMARG